MNWRTIRSLTAAVMMLAFMILSSAHASAAGVQTTRLGINVKAVLTDGVYSPSNLAVGSKNGLGLVRTEVDEGTNADALVRWLAQSHLHLYPVLGLPCPAGTAQCTPQTQIPPSTAASEMATYITAFAQRYGVNGSFWSANPSLPYVPVTHFEIGNEPNIRMIWVQDQTHLHWPRPSNSNFADMADYAQVYTAARSALHKVDPTGVAVVGGLADSASYGVDVLSDISLLKALPKGGVDAVGYHPWVYDVSDTLLRPDTLQLRNWMDQNGFRGKALDINEFGACRITSSQTGSQACTHAQSSQAWGSAATGYTDWAMCTSWLHTADLLPFFWGGVSSTDQEIWLPLFTSNDSVTAYGNDFLAEAKSLTSAGCSSPATGSTAPVNSTKPSFTGTPVSGDVLTGNAGKWTGSPAPNLYYQWVRCNAQGRDCIAIDGANSNAYRLAPDDEGSTDALIVIAGNTAGSATVWTGRTSVIKAPS